MILAHRIELAPTAEAAAYFKQRCSLYLDLGLRRVGTSVSRRDEAGSQLPTDVFQHHQVLIESLSIFAGMLLKEASWFGTIGQEQFSKRAEDEAPFAGCRTLGATDNWDMDRKFITMQYEVKA